MMHSIKKLLSKIILFLFISISIGCASKSVTKKNLESYKDTIFTAYFHRSSGWISGDGATSIPLNNDKSLWVFGDSHIDHFDVETQTVPCLFQARNSAIVMGTSDPKEQKTLIGEKSYTFFQVGTDNNYWFWPGAGFVNNDTAYIFQGRLHNTGEGGMWAFENVDSLYVAKMHIPSMQVVGYSRLGGRNNISFGNGVIEDGNHYYVYGIKNNDLGNDLMVARFANGNPETQWEYFDGTGWSENATDAAKIFAEFSASFYVFKHKSKYVLITTEFSVDCDQGKEIYSYTSDTPFGPFENKKTIWTVDDTVNGHYPFFYLAAAHPEYDNGKNELLITYCINGYGKCFDMCIDGRMDPNHYRPKAVRVPYKLIDKSF